MMQVFNVDTFHGTPVATKRSSVASIEKKVTHRISCKVREAALAGWLARPLACAQEERISRTVHSVFLRARAPRTTFNERTKRKSSSDVSSYYYHQTSSSFPWPEYETLAGTKGSVGFDKVVHARL